MFALLYRVRACLSLNRACTDKLVEGFFVPRLDGQRHSTWHSGEKAQYMAELRKVKSTPLWRNSTEHGTAEKSTVEKSTEHSTVHHCARKAAPAAKS